MNFTIYNFILRIFFTFERLFDAMDEEYFECCYYDITPIYFKLQKKVCIAM